MVRFMRHATVAAMVATLAAGGVAASRRSAPAAELGPPLWRDLRAGMTEAETRRLQPHRVLQLSGLCVGRVRPLFTGRRLARVALSGRGAAAVGQYCAASIEKTLIAQYGPSDPALTRALEDAVWSPERPAPPRALGGLFDPFRDRIAAWDRQGTTILFRASRYGSSWSVTYVPDPAGIAPAQL